MPGAARSGNALGRPWTRAVSAYGRKAFHSSRPRATDPALRVHLGEPQNVMMSARNGLDRGHLARRADLVWGSLPVARKANIDSFYFTNITPQVDDFNQSVRNGVCTSSCASYGRSSNPVRSAVPTAAADIRCSRGTPLSRRRALRGGDPPAPGRARAETTVIGRTGARPSTGCGHVVLDRQSDPAKSPRYHHDRLADRTRSSSPSALLIIPPAPIAKVLRCQWRIHLRNRRSSACTASKL
jgi:hypothetical protein